MMDYLQARYLSLLDISSIRQGVSIREQVQVKDRKTECNMNHQVNVIIAGADMGGLIASCALRSDLKEKSRQEQGFLISRIEKDTLTMEGVEQCDLSGIDFAVNATLHDSDASFAFDEKCKEQGIAVIHAVNLGKAAFLAVEKPKGYPFSEVVKRGTEDFRCALGKYISQYGMFWQMPVPWVDEAIKNYSQESFPQLSIGAYVAAGYCANLLVNLVEGKEVKYFPKFYLSPLLEEI